VGVDLMTTAPPEVRVEPDAFSDWVAARGRALWSAAWLRTGGRALAEDLVQTALVRRGRTSPG
jgi:DNA-directed RNA polymerase specialized sigma24 family protein